MTINAEGHQSYRLKMRGSAERKRQSGFQRPDNERKSLIVLQ